MVITLAWDKIVSTFWWFIAPFLFITFYKPLLKNKYFIIFCRTYIILNSFSLDEKDLRFGWDLRPKWAMNGYVSLLSFYIFEFLISTNIKFSFSYISMNILQTYSVRNLLTMKHFMLVRYFIRRKHFKMQLQFDFFALLDLDNGKTAFFLEH